MSELAFNLSGERFELPPKAAAWRVRRMKPKGAPEVVYGRSGIPLILPIDADIDDLRQEARMEGRYRLDPVDENGRPIETASAGYVCVQPSDAPELSPAAGRGPSENPVIEAMRMNTELARTIIDKFPQMLESAAALLRAADGAAMPARPPRPVVVEADEDETEDEAPDAEEAAPRASGWAAILESIMPFVAPAIINAVTSGKLAIPGGLGALFDCRRATPPKASAAAARAASPPAGGPAPGPRDPAPARRASSPVRASSPRHPSPVAEDASSARAVDPRAASPAGAPVTGASAEDHAELASDAEPAMEAAEKLPTLDPAALAHFAAIQGALTFRESMLARALAAELSPADLRAWLTDLRALSVPEAVAKVRSVLGPDASAPTAGGAS